jgi:hypothetical protein
MNLPFSLANPWTISSMVNLSSVIIDAGLILENALSACIYA